MSFRPEDLLYLASHEWAKVSQEGSDQVATIGISAFAVEQLTDLVYMALPTVGQTLSAGQEFGEVESVKAVSPMYSPLSGVVIATNEPLVDRLESLATDPYEAGWMIKVRMTNPSEVDGLLKYADYSKQCSGH